MWTLACGAVEPAPCADMRREGPVISAFTDVFRPILAAASYCVRMSPLPVTGMPTLSATV